MGANYAASHWVCRCQQAGKTIYRSERTSMFRSCFVDSVRVEILFLHSYDTVGLSQRQIWAKPVLHTDLSISSISPVRLSAKGEKCFFGMPLHGCQLSYLQVQQAHHLSILASAEGLAGFPGTDMFEAVGLDSGPSIREGLCKESLVIILAEKSSFVAFCSMELFSFQKQCSQTKWLFLLLRFIDPGSCLKQVHPERFGS